MLWGLGLGCVWGGEELAVCVRCVCFCVDCAVDCVVHKLHNTLQRLTVGQSERLSVIPPGTKPLADDV